MTRRFRWPSLPTLTGVLAGSALTLLMWQNAKDLAERERKRVFAQRVEHAQLALESTRADVFAKLQLIKTLAERGPLTDLSFRNTLGAQDQRLFASGLQFIGYLAAVPARDQSCTPVSDTSMCLQTAMLYPRATNGDVLALDMLSLDSRRNAIERAIDSGYVALTGPLGHAIDSVADPGLMAFVPVYRLGAELTSVQARRRAVTGIAVASFSLEFLLRGELGRQFLDDMSVRIIDEGTIRQEGEQDAEPAMLLDTLSLRRTLAADDGVRQTDMTVESRIEVAGRRWHLVFGNMPVTVAGPWFSPQHFILLLGSSLTLLLALYLQSLTGARRRAEDLARRMTSSLRTREAQLHQALDAASMGSWQWEARSQHFSFDERAGRLLAPQDGPLKNLFAPIHRRDRRLAQQAFKTAARDGHPFLTECRLATRTAGVLWIELSARLTLDASGRVARVSGLVRDITERNELAAARRRLLHKLVNAEEKERRRIARELHDQLGQEITAINLGLRNLEALPDDSPARAELLGKLHGIVHDIDNRVDKFMLDLRPVVLDDLGLEAALAAQFAQWTDLHNIPVNSHITGLSKVNLPFEVATTAFRVVQESLTNVAKHAQATSVDVIVELNRGELKVVVEDNGVGISGEKSAHSYGLAGIQERVESLGGTYRQESRPNEGFTVFVHLPASLELVVPESVSQVA